MSHQQNRRSLHRRIRHIQLNQVRRRNHRNQYRLILLVLAHRVHQAIQLDQAIRAGVHIQPNQATHPCQVQCRRRAARVLE